jgi:hypothetical protein
MKLITTTNTITITNTNTIYEQVTRDSDFVAKNIPALKIAASPMMTTVVAYFESPDSTGVNKSAARSLTKRGSVSNIMNQPKFESSQSFSANVNKNRASMVSSGGGGGAPPTPGSEGNAGPKKMFLAYFENGHISANGGKVLPMDVAVTALAFGLAEPSRSDPSQPGEMLVIGLADGRVLISLLPLPLRVLEGAASMSMHIIVRTTTSMADTPASETAATAGAVSDTISTSPHGNPRLGRAETPGKGEGEDELAELPASPGHEDQAVSLHALDEGKCRGIALHDGAVVSVRVSPTGNWILTAGFDGCMFSLSTTVRAKTMDVALESQGGDNSVFLTDRLSLLGSKTQLEVMEQFVADAELEKNRSIEEMESSMKKHEEQVTSHLQSELSRRDDLIVKGREEQTRLCRIMQEDIDGSKETHEKQMSELEVYYEKRIAQNQQYLQGMVQAYEEKLAHAKRDVGDLRLEGDACKRLGVTQRDGIVAETDKQKAVMLQYCDYISERNKEVFVELEETHDVEKTKLKADLANKAEAITMLKQKNRTDIAVVHRQVMLQKEELSGKDMQILTQKQELEILVGKLHRLDKSLSEATAEIVRRTEIAERWEFKAGAQQQQLSEIEKVRKALTTQLHSLREKLGPQWELLVRTEDRLKEVDNEYGQSLVHLSEKEAKLAHAGSIVQLMQKQLRELRAKVTRKDHSLSRAVKILVEFELRMEEAKFENGRKITVKKLDPHAMAETYAVVSDSMSPGKVASGKAKGGGKSRDGQSMGGSLGADGKWGGATKVMDVFSSTPEMQASLKRLRDILTSAVGAENAADTSAAVDDSLTEEQKVVMEQQRQMSLLQKNIVGLKSNLKLSSEVSSTKIHHFLHDNDYLLEQVNSLRQQVRALTNENRMLNAQEVFSEAKKISHSVSVEREDDYSDGSGQVAMPRKHRKSILSSNNNSNNHNSNNNNNNSTSTLHTAGAGLSAYPAPLAPMSLVTNSQFGAPPLHATAPAGPGSGPGFDPSPEDSMVGSLGLSRDDIIAQTMSQESSVDRGFQVVIKSGGSKNQSAADRKIAEILDANQRLIAELNLETHQGAAGQGSVADLFSDDILPSTPDLNMSRGNSATGPGNISSFPRSAGKRVSSPDPPGRGVKVSTHLSGKKAPVSFGGLKPRQGMTTQGQIYAPAKTALQMKPHPKPSDKPSANGSVNGSGSGSGGGMKLSASVNNLSLPPVMLAPKK